MNKSLRCVLLLLFQIAVASHPYQDGQFVGRIAYSSDGNHNDPDDWAASPLVLAILSHAGLKDHLVHFDYNSILPLTDTRFEKEHTESVLGAMQRYDFDKSIFHDCRKNPDQTVASIARAINASSAENPLYFVIAGPMEVPFLGIQKSDPARRKFVYCISHSRWNDGFASQYKFTFTKRTVIEQDIHWVQIRDQNRLLSLSPYGRVAAAEQFSVFHWMRDSQDPRTKFLWERMLASTRPDPSDAGMVYFLATGEEECDSAKLEALIEKRQPLSIIREREQVRIEAENFRHFYGLTLETTDKTASHGLNVKAAAPRAQLRTKYDEPFTAAHTSCNIVVRYFENKEASSEYQLVINGTPRGPKWKSKTEATRWTSHTIQNAEIKPGDEIRLDLEGTGARVDYVQIERREPSSDSKP